MSKTREAPAWHIDFISSQAANVEREKQLNKLNVLANAGLLIKSTEAISLNGEKLTVERFRLSNKGWAADRNTRYSTCFVFGKTNYQNTKSFDRKIIPNHAEMEVYNVHGTIGIRSTAEMPDWAQRKDVQSEFPIIKESLAGKSFQATIIKENNKWVDASFSLMKIMLANSPDAIKSIENDAKKREMRAAKEKTPDSLKPDLPPATPEEIKSILEESYLINDVLPNSNSCVSLPGDSDLPVDKDSSTRQPKRYAFEIFKNKERNDRDPILIRTIPYINQLEKIGVLRKEKSNSSENISSYKYELAEKYADKIDPQYL
ncbi:MAG: hypothetical protein EOO07_39365, partial [Chitinophagaceae bacterium]